MSLAIALVAGCSQPAGATRTESSIALSQVSTSLFAGESFQLTATVSPSNSTVLWASSDPSVAAVSSSGLVSGLKTGTVQISASTVDGATKAECAVAVADFSASLVTGLQASIGPNNAFDISWNSLPGSDFYELEQSWTGQSVWTVAKTNLTSGLTSIPCPSISDVWYFGSIQTYDWLGRVTAYRGGKPSQVSGNVSLSANVSYIYDTTPFSGNECQFVQLSGNQYQINFQIKNQGNVTIHDVKVILDAFSSPNLTGSIDQHILNVPGPIDPGTSCYVSSPIYAASFVPLSGYLSNSRYNVN